eukprot:6273119-Karenia_brevis.AAC.1
METTPEPEFANGVAVAGARGTATVFVRKNVKSDKLTMLPFGSNVPIPDEVAPPPVSPSKIESLKQAAINTISAGKNVVRK